MNKKHILIIRNDLIGDFILWLDSAKYIKQNFIDIKISIVCADSCKELAEKIAIFDDIITVKTKKIMKMRIWHLLNTAFKIRRLKYDTVICPQYRRNIVVDFLVWITKANRKIGVDAFYGKFEKLSKGLFNRCYDELFKNNNLNQMELLLNIDFTNHVFSKNYKASLPDFKSFDVHIEPNSLYHRYIVVCLGSSVKHRSWPVENYIRLIKNISKTENVIIVGTKGDSEDADHVLSTLKNNNIISIVGQTSFYEVMQIITVSKLYIGNESGLSHLAVALKIPSVCFLGGGHFSRFMPYVSDELSDINSALLPFALYQKMDCYGCDWKCKYDLVNGSTWRCISDIDVDNAIDKILKKINYINSMEKKVANV